MARSHPPHATTALAFIALAALLALWVYAWTHPTTRDAIGRDQPIYLIDINHAEPAQLQLLPRIGPALSQRITDDRQANGPFQRAGDLERVRGIGPLIRAGIEPYLSWSTGKPDTTNPH